MSVQVGFFEVRNWLNTVAVGDNLELMRSLPSNSIDLIYCDILYGTGRDFEDYLDIKASRELVYEHYVPRIKGMYSLLKPTGSIYLQMDTTISHWVRCIMDDVFGYKHFRNEITVKKRDKGANNVATKYFGKNNDRILFYTKSNNYTFNTAYRPLSENSIARYNLVRDGKLAQLTSIVSETTNPLRKLVWKGKVYENHYAWTQATLDARIADGVIIEENTKGDLAYVRFLEDSKGKAFSDYWHEFTYDHIPNKVYKTEKPSCLLEHIIKVSSNKGDVVADFYNGSGVTVSMAKKLGRQYYGCDINPKAIEITNKKLKGKLVV